MTDRLQAAARAALEAWEAFDSTTCIETTLKAFEDLRAALAKQDAEPVMWSHNLIRDNVIRHRPADIDRHPERWTALYAHPPTRGWVGLTDEEIADAIRPLCGEADSVLRQLLDFSMDEYRAIEQKLKERNT